eukprot:SAG22_NODE_9845_length_566_cov_1.725910_2_plen_36_part_01
MTLYFKTTHCDTRRSISSKACLSIQAVADVTTTTDG